MKTGWEISNFENEFMFQEGPGVRNWQFTETGIKLLNVANIEKTGFLNLAKTSRHLSFEEVESKYKHFLCDAGDLVIASSGISFDSDGYLRTRGVFIENEHLPLCLNTSTIRFKSKNNNSLFFLKHWLQSTEFRKQITRLVTGSAQQNFGPSHLKQIKIKIPPISEQKRIAAILDKADEIRRKREQAITKLEQLAQSIFVEMFGNPVTNNKGWEFKKWDEVLKIINGKNQKNVLTINGAYPIFGSGGNEMGRANNFLCNENTIIIGRKGNINKPILIKEKFWNVDTAFGLQAKKEFLSFQYLYWFCVFFNFEKLNKTVTIPSLTKSDLLQIEIPLPPIALQEEFAKRIKQIEKLKADNTMALANHNALFASLQQQAFSGNL